MIDAELLIKEYTPLIRSIANKFRLPGGSREDLFQEACISVFRMAKTYDESRGIPLGAYVAICSKNAMISELRRATSNKNDIINSSATIDGVYEHYLKSQFNQENAVLEKELINDVHGYINSNLKGVEKDVAFLILERMPYSKIASELNIEKKVADNACQRVKKKLRNFIINR